MSQANGSSSELDYRCKQQFASQKDKSQDPAIVSTTWGQATLLTARKRPRKASPSPNASKGKSVSNQSLLPAPLTDAPLDPNINETGKASQAASDVNAKPSACATPTISQGSLAPGQDLAIYLSTPTQPLLLIRPKFASGTYGDTSVWLGVNDQKLYLRKFEGTQYGARPRDITHASQVPMERRSRQRHTTTCLLVTSWSPTKRLAARLPPQSTRDSI